MPDATPEQPVELIPTSTEILQPSPQDRLNELKDITDYAQVHLEVIRQRMEDDGLPPYRTIEPEEQLGGYRKEQADLEIGDHRIARITSIHELGVDRGVLWDYMLLIIANTDWRGTRPES